MLLALIFLIIKPVVYGASFCTTDSMVCFVSTPFNNQMFFELTTKSKGWVGIGIGSSMSNAKIIMAYTTENNTASVTYRTSRGQNLPTLDSVQKVKSFIPRIPSANGLYQYAFSIPIEDPLTQGNVSMIYAYKDSPVQNDNLVFHDGFGVIRVIDLFATASSFDNSGNRKLLIQAHAILMFISWYILSTFGVFVARFMKSLLGVWWFRIHIGTLTLALLGTIVALVLIVLAEGQNFDGPHQILGLLVVSLSIFQGILGVVIDTLFNPNRISIPWYDKLHWWVGRVLYVLGIVTIFLGIPLLYVGTDYSGVLLGFGILVFLTVLVFGLAQFKFGQSHHAENKQAIPMDDYNN
jgi:hypothetical protein